MYELNYFEHAHRIGNCWTISDPSTRVPNYLSSGPKLLLHYDLTNFTNARSIPNNVFITEHTLCIMEYMNTCTSIVGCIFTITWFRFNLSALCLLPTTDCLVKGIVLTQQSIWFRIINGLQLQANWRTSSYLNKIRAVIRGIWTRGKRACMSF